MARIELDRQRTHSRGISISHRRTTRHRLSIPRHGHVPSLHGGGASICLPVAIQLSVNIRTLNNIHTPYGRVRGGTAANLINSPVIDKGLDAGQICRPLPVLQEILKKQRDIMKSLPFTKSYSNISKKKRSTQKNQNQILLQLSQVDNGPQDFINSNRGNNNSVEVANNINQNRYHYRVLGAPEKIPQQNDQDNSTYQCNNDGRTHNKLRLKGEKDTKGKEDSQVSLQELSDRQVSQNKLENHIRVKNKVTPHNKTGDRKYYHHREYENSYSRN